MNIFFKIIHFFLLVSLTYYHSSAFSLQVNNLSCLEQLKPGEKKEIKITLLNDSEIKEEVHLKLADYSCNSEGEHFFDEETSLGAPEEYMKKYPRSARSWIHFGHNHLILAPNETKDIYYTIEVPQNENLKGSYWSVLLIEPLGKPAVVNPEQEGFSLIVKIRYAHHSVINVGESLPKLKIIKKEIKELAEKKYLCLHVLNEGDLFYDPSLTLKLYDTVGKLKKTLEAGNERLYPGNSQCFMLNLNEMTENELQDKDHPLKGFLLFDGKNKLLFGDKFSYP